jgi:hypothetical protein
VQSFVANQNTQHLLNANKHAENILTQIPTIVVMAAPDDITGLREAATSFRRSAAQLIRHLEEEATSLRQTMVQDHEQSDQDIEESKNQLVKLEAQIEKVQEEIQTQKSRLDSAIAEFQNQFSKQQESRQEKFTEGEKERADANQLAIEEQEEKFESICTSAGEKLAAFHESSQEAAQSHIETLGELLKQAEKLVHVIGNTGMVGGYQKTANTARNTARFWQVVAVLSFAGLITFAILLFYSTQKPDFAWSIFAGRAFVAGTFGLAAAYASRLSDRHEEVERYNRRVELELASIDPYLVGIPEPKQQEIKEELAKRMFGQKPLPRKDSKVSGTNADTINLLRDLVIELVKKQG